MRVQIPTGWRDSGTQTSCFLEEQLVTIAPLSSLVIFSCWLGFFGKWYCAATFSSDMGEDMPYIAMRPCFFLSMFGSRTLHV